MNLMRIAAVACALMGALMVGCGDSPSSDTGDGGAADPETQQKMEQLYAWPSDAGEPRSKTEDTRVCLEKVYAEHPDMAKYAPLGAIRQHMLCMGALGWKEK